MTEGEERINSLLALVEERLEDAYQQGYLDGLARLAQADAAVPDRKLPTHYGRGK